MPEWSNKEIGRILTSKGFIEEPPNKHRKFMLMVEGKKTDVRTVLSHGKGNVSSKTRLFKHIREQLMLETNNQLVEFLSCSLSEEAYKASLLERGHIIPDDS